MADQGISIKVDANDLMAAITDLSANQAPYVLAVALTKTAQDIQRVEQFTMGSVFDRPTPFTLNSMYVRPATKADPTAVVDFKDGFNSVPAWRYLGPEVRGGGRALKSHELRLQRAGILKGGEYAVPAEGVALDSYGNMRASDIERILSQVKAAEQFAGYDANASGSRRSSTKRGMLAYFVLRGKKAHDGIYLRRAGSREITPVLMFVRAPVYRPRFPFYETAREVFASGFLANARAVWNSIKLKSSS